MSSLLLHSLQIEPLNEAKPFDLRINIWSKLVEGTVIFVPVDVPVSAGDVTGIGTEDIIDAGDSKKEDESAQDYFVLPIWSSYSSTIKRSRADNAGAAPHKHPDLKIDKKPVDNDNQVFLDELERLKMQEKDANDAAEALRKEFAQETENLLIQVRAAKASSTNIVNIVSTPISTASPYDGPSLSDPTNPEQDDSEIPALEDIYQNPTDGIFTYSSYDDEGAVADFTNLLGICCEFQTRSKDKYVAEILKKFDFIGVKTASTPIETHKPLVKDEEASDVDVHLYRSMIGSLMYLTASRPGIMFAVCACFRELISWQEVKKQTIVATFTTEAEYVAATNCCGQVLWIQNQMLDYGFNFMNTKIYIDNESTICIVKNPIFHSKTKHIAIRHHFIRDAYEKKLIQVCQIKRMSTLVFVDPKSSTQADRAQSSRVPVPLPQDPSSSTSLPKSTPPTLVPILHKTARMAVRVSHAMSSGLSANMAEVAAMSEFAFRKRFRSSYESSPFVLPLDLLLQKRYQGTSELVEDSEEEDAEEDEEIEESLDSDSVSEDAEDEGPTVEDEDPAVKVEGLTAGVEGPSMDDKSHGIDDESHGLDDESRGLNKEDHSAESDGLGLEEEEEAVPKALRHQELVLEEDHVYSTFEVGQGFRSAPDSERPERVSEFRQPTLTTWIDPKNGMVYIDVPVYPPPAPPVQTPPLPK
ncbi:hypothetical protein Tco_1502421 [Tanacetum coccineum]